MMKWTTARQTKNLDYTPRQAEKIPHVLERVKKDREHCWWEAIFGWPPTATGIFNLVLHPIVVLLVLAL